MGMVLSSYEEQLPTGLQRKQEHLIKTYILKAVSTLSQIKRKGRRFFIYSQWHVSSYLKEIYCILEEVEVWINKSNRLCRELKIKGKLSALSFLEFIASISVLSAGIQRLRDFVALLGLHDPLSRRKFRILHPSSTELL